MNYQKHYDTLINRAKNRLLEGYSERHHIIPRCMGGTNRKDNLVALTAEEHYVAHQLLVKMYPDNDKLIYAAQMMTISSSHNIRNNKLYGWLKLKVSASKKEYFKDNPEARAKLSASMKEFLKNNPEKHPMKNPESRAKRSVFMKEFLKNNPEKNPMKNPEARAKISASMTEYSNKPEVKAKMSAITKEKNPMKNPQTRAKMSASKKEYYKNNPEKHPMKNPESRAKASASMKEYHRKKKLANG